METQHEANQSPREAAQPQLEQPFDAAATGLRMVPKLEALRQKGFDFYCLLDDDIVGEVFEKRIEVSGKVNKVEPAPEGEGTLMELQTASGPVLFRSSDPFPLQPGQEISVKGIQVVPFLSVQLFLGADPCSVWAIREELVEKLLTDQLPWQLLEARQGENVVFRPQETAEFFAERDRCRKEYGLCERYNWDNLLADLRGEQAAESMESLEQDDASRVLAGRSALAALKEAGFDYYALTNDEGVGDVLEKQLSLTGSIFHLEHTHHRTSLGSFETEDVTVVGLRAADGRTAMFFARGHLALETDGEYTLAGQLTVPFNAFHAREFNSSEEILSRQSSLIHYLLEPDVAFLATTISRNGQEVYRDPVAIEDFGKRAALRAAPGALDPRCNWDNLLRHWGEDLVD